MIAVFAGTVAFALLLFFISTGEERKFKREIFKLKEENKRLKRQLEQAPFRRGDRNG